MSLKSYKSNTYFTKTDKLVNYVSSIIILLLIIIGQMNINLTDLTIQAALISIIGAIIAAYGAALLNIFLTNRTERKKEKKLIIDTKIALTNILKDVYLDGINKMEEDYSSLKEAILADNTTTYLFQCDTIFLKMKIYEVIKNENIITLFSRYNIEISKWFYFKTFTKILYENSPSAIAERHTELINHEIEENKKDITYIKNNPEVFENNPSKFTALRLERNRETLQSYRQNNSNACSFYLETLLKYKELVNYLMDSLK